MTLIEPEIDPGAGGRAALAGLHAAIDDLEKLARLTLADGDGARRPGPPRIASSSVAEATALGEILAAARREIEAANPGVEWTVGLRDGAEAAIVEVERETLLEMFVILMRNAVEAMDGQGQGRIELSRLGRFARISVADRGPASCRDAREGAAAGVTTKEKGSGFGLSWRAGSRPTGHSSSATSRRGAPASRCASESEVADGPDGRPTRAGWRIRFWLQRTSARRAST